MKDDMRPTPEKGVRRLLCARCNIELEPAQTFFSYLTHGFHTILPRCPRCGQVFIDEELVKGRMARVEMELEDK